MVVFVESKSHEELIDHPDFNRLKSRLCTFKEGNSSTRYLKQEKNAICVETLQLIVQKVTQKTFHNCLIINDQSLD